jgi:membrane dipeptidase
MAHMCHALNVCGEDHVGIGSDSLMSRFDTSPEAMAEFNKETERRKATGVAAPEEDRPRYSERVAEKVLGLNFVNALTEIWE